MGTDDAWLSARPLRDGTLTNQAPCSRNQSAATPAVRSTMSGWS